MPKKPSAPNAFALRLRTLREAKRWSAAELARRAGIDPTQLGRFERGDRAPLLETARKLALALGESLSVWD